MDVAKAGQTVGPDGKHGNGCPAVGEVLNRVGDKWTVLVVSLLVEDTKRFGQLRRSSNGISQPMLAHTLKGLERDGLVVDATIPARRPWTDAARTQPAGTGK